MSFPILFAPEEKQYLGNGIGVLSDCINCLVTEEANGAYELSMAYPTEGIHFDEIALRYILKVRPNNDANPQLFRIYSISKPLNKIATIKAAHISYDLSGIPVSPFTASGIIEALKGLKENAVAECPFEFWTDKSSDGLFESIAPASIRSKIGGSAGSILSLYGGELEFDNFTVKVHRQRGEDRGFSIRYGKNLMDFKQNENCGNVATGIYPFWLSIDGDNLVELPEKVIAAPGNYSFSKIRVKDFSQDFETAPTEEQLRNRAEQYVKNNDIGTPSVSFDISFAMLSQSEEYRHLGLLETARLFDQVTIQFPDMNCFAKAKIVKTVYNPLLRRMESISVGNVRANIADTMADQLTAIQSLPTKADVKNAQETATEWLTNGKGYEYKRRDENGMVIETFYLDAPDIEQAVNVLRIGQSGIGFSHNGIGGPYESAWTLDGNFLANFIKSGQLTSQDGSVVFDLNGGSLEIHSISDDGKKTMFSMSKNGIYGFSENEDSQMEQTLEIIFGKNGQPSGLWNPSWQYNTGLSIGAQSGTLDMGTSEVPTNIYGSTIKLFSVFLDSAIEVGLDYLKILGKTVEWSDNGDGTYSLVGRD